MKTLIAALALTGMSLIPVTESYDCLAAATTQEQQQDCCKKNKGVCGCRAGKIVCCDKTFAEGCSC